MPAETEAPDLTEPPDAPDTARAAAAGPMPRYEPDATDWTATPWPSDRHLLLNSTLNLSGFPNPNDVDVLAAYITVAEQTLGGWGLNGSVYFQFDAALDPATFPTPAASLQDAAPSIRLVNVTPDSPHRGERVPLTARFHTQSTDPYLPDNTLMLRPVPGFPMRAGSTWCAVLTEDLHGIDGRAVQSNPAFVAALKSAPSLSALADWLDEDQRTAVVAATCFTTSRPMDALIAVHDALQAMDAPHLETIKDGKPKTYYEQRVATYHAPNYQAGDKPYNTDGDIRFDMHGAPIVQLDELIKVRVLVPRTPPPPAGYPVMIYGHGTGGGNGTCTKVVGPRAAKLGYAMLCLDQPLHGIRGVEGTDESFHSFNFLNPNAGRTGFLQSAIDSFTLIRMIEDGSFWPIARLNPDLITYYGHSHGALSGALLFATDPRVVGGLINGTSGVLIETVLARKDPTDFALLVRALASIHPDDFDGFHPVLSLVQMVGDITDPVNYAHRWFDPAPGGTPKHLVFMSGTADPTSPNIGAMALAASGALPAIAPPGADSLAFTLRNMQPVQEPVQGNIRTRAGLRTAAISRWVDGPHSVGQSNPRARKRWQRFFETLLDHSTAPPIIGP